MISAQEAWTVLGFRAEEVFSRLQKLDRSLRVAAAKEDLEMARKAARKLLALHHPDTGGDPARFKRVNEAVQTLEKHVEDFETRMKEVDKRAEERLESRPVFIKVGD